MTPPMTAPFEKVAGGSAEDEAGGDADERQRLRERDADEHLRRQAALELGLTGDALDRLADDDADADAGADRGEAVTDGRDVAGEGGESGGVHLWFSFRGRQARFSCALRVVPAGRPGRCQCSSASESWRYTAVSSVKMYACSAATNSSKSVNAKPNTSVPMPKRVKPFGPCWKKKNQVAEKNSTSSRWPTSMFIV